VHSVDLAITTNVHEVFPDKEEWTSPYVNRSGHWIFNFTADEVEQLTVRQRLPDGRTTMYDGVWKIPRLEDALQVLQEWNRVHLPLTLVNETESTELYRPSRLALAQAGLYIELKDANWLLQEANLNLVDLMFEHFETHHDHWEDLLEKQCYTQMRFDEYKVPGLVLQSFDVEALEDFHQKWPLHFRDQVTPSEEDETSTTTKRLAPEPPYVLLVNHHGCTGLEADEFWVKVGNEWDGFLSGIGCDKNCLMGEQGKVFATKAQEFKLVLHPWTERPEQSFLMPGFESALQETLYLMCSPGVEGVFTESVSTAVLAAELGCEGSETISPTLAPVKDSKDHPQDGDHTSEGLCYESTSEETFYTSLASFVMGAFLASCISIWLHRKRRRRYGDGRAVPTAELEGELELTIT
jgi:hypothetical protein